MDGNKVYVIQVKLEFTNYPQMKDECVKLAKQHFNKDIFHSQQDTSTHEQLKAYLTATHSSQITNFQPLANHGTSKEETVRK